MNMKNKWFLTLMLAVAALMPVSLQAAQKQVVLKVKEMTCQLCAYLVNQELREVEGVITTKASIKDKSVTVIADEQVSHEALIQAVKKLEYSAEVVP